MASSLRRDIEAFVSTELSPAARSKAFASFARTERDALIKSGKASTLYRTSVDGREGADEDTVKGTGGGVINYRFSFLGDALQYALAFLRARTTKVSGKLSESYWVSINDRFIPAGTPIDYKSIKPGDEIVIGNIEPYWRKADVNYVGQRRLKYRNPGVLDDAVAAISKEFGRGALSVFRKYTYNFPGKYRPVLSPNRVAYIFHSPVIILKEVA